MHDVISPHQQASRPDARQRQPRRSAVLPSLSPKPKPTALDARRIVTNAVSVCINASRVTENSKLRLRAQRCRFRLGNVMGGDYGRFAVARSYCMQSPSGVCIGPLCERSIVHPLRHDRDARTPPRCYRTSIADTAEGIEAASHLAKTERLKRGTPRTVKL